MAIMFAAASAGVISSWLSAWSCAWLVRQRTFDAALNAERRAETWESQDSERLGDQVWVRSAFRGFGCETVLLDRADPSKPTHASLMSRPVIHHRAGWPVRCLAGEERPAGPAASTFDGALPVAEGVALDFNTATNQGKMGAMGATTVTGVLPLRPLWPLFAGNAALHASALLVAWLALRGSRRAIRRWRGRCPSCAYPIGTSATCTECGRNLRTAWFRPAARNGPTAKLPA